MASNANLDSTQTLTIGPKGCKGKNNRGQPCQGWALKGTNCCYKHGGAGIKKGGAPVRSGNRSKALRNLGLSNRFDDAFEDPAILSSRANIATHEALINSILEGSEPTLPMWEEASKLYDAYQKDPDELHSLKRLGSLLAEGLENAEKINRAVNLMESQRKHKESEIKREAELSSNLRAKEANMLMGAVAVLIETFVPRDKLPEAARKFQELMKTATGSEIVRVN